MTRIVAVMVLCLAFVFASAAVARADDRDSAMFCRLLDVNHTPAGVMHAIQYFLDRGYGVDAATAIVVDAVTVLCPWYADDLARADNIVNKRIRT